MPAFIRSEKDEIRWAKAKRLARKNYKNLSENDSNFWAITTSIYKKLNGGNMKKTASSRVLNVLRKLAYVPLTPAAQEAMQQQPPMDPAMMQGGGMPPMDPSMMGGQPSMPPQGGGAAIQTVPGPNGEPMDPETGFIVVDPANGIEMEPMTGILFVKPTGEFMSPDGQPIPPDQAMSMIEQAAQQAMQQGGVPPMDPSMGGAVDPTAGGQPPMDPAMMGADPSMMGGAPMDPSMGSGMPMDPAAQMASGGPVIDPQSGLPIDPSTGMFMQQPSAEGGVEGGLEAAMPGFQEFVDKYDKIADRQDKLNKRMLHDLSGTRTDIQGVRREIQQLNDDQDTMLARLENVLNLLEQMLGGGVRQGDSTLSAMPR